MVLHWDLALVVAATFALIAAVALVPTPETPRSGRGAWALFVASAGMFTLAALMSGGG